MSTQGLDDRVCENGKCCQFWRMRLEIGDGNSRASSGALVAPLTLLGDPAAEVINPVVRGGKSRLASPTVLGSGPFPSFRWGGLRYGDGRKHGTSCHSMLGYEASKQPFFGKGARAIALRQASRFAASVSAVCAAVGKGETFWGVIRGAGCGAACAMSRREAAPDKKSPPSMLAAKTKPRRVTATGLNLAFHCVWRTLSSEFWPNFLPPRRPSYLGYAIPQAIFLPTIVPLLELDPAEIREKQVSQNHNLIIPRDAFACAGAN
jgi:hypothetical protein